MANVLGYRVPFSYAQGLQPGQTYNGWISWSAAPFIPFSGAVFVSALSNPVGNTGLVITSTYISGNGPAYVNYSMKYSGYNSLTNWTIFVGVIQP